MGEIGPAATAPFTFQDAMTPTNQRDPGVVVWPSGSLEAWGTDAKKPNMFRYTVVFGLAAFCGKAKQTFVSG
jgi:hypothetical protein